MSNVLQSNNVYTTTVKYDPVEDEYYIELNDAILAEITQSGWIIDDELEWHVLDNRAAILYNRSLHDRTEPEEEEKREENDNSI